MHVIRRGLCVSVFLLGLAFSLPAAAQSGFEDDRVMLQGFYWESYRHGHPEKFPNYGDKHWYVIVQSLAPAIRAAAST